MAKKRLNCTKIVKEWLHHRNWFVGDVEQTIPHTFIKRDLFGFLDVIAVKERLIGIQITSRANMSSRIKKAQDQDAYGAFINAADAYVVGVDVADGAPRLKWFKLGDDLEVEP